MAFSTSTSPEHSEINVTPMIDVLLVLLIIFMVITPLTPHGLESQVPQPSKQSVAPEQESPVMIDVLAPEVAGGAARVLVNTASVAPGELADHVAALLKSRRDRVVFLRADRTLPFDSVAQTIALVKAGGAESIGLAGAPPTASQTRER